MFYDYCISERQSLKSSTVIIIDLETDTNFGLGIAVSVFDNGSVVVKSLMRNGPAERDGRLHIGDRINSIDGHSLNGTTQVDVDRLIRESHGKVRIIASRDLSWKSNPELSPGGFSNFSRDYVLNARSVKSVGGESSGNGIFRNPSVDCSDVDLDGGRSPESLSGCRLTTAEFHRKTTGL